MLQLSNLYNPTSYHGQLTSKISGSCRPSKRSCSGSPRASCSSPVRDSSATPCPASPCPSWMESSPEAASPSLSGAATHSLLPSSSAQTSQTASGFCYRRRVPLLFGKADRLPRTKLRDPSIPSAEKSREKLEEALSIAGSRRSLIEEQS